MRRYLISLSALIVFLCPGQVLAQVTGMHLLGTGELQAPAPPQVSKQPPTLPAQRLPAAPAVSGFVLNQVVIEGVSSVPSAVLQTAWAPAIGHKVNAADLALIAQRIGEMESNADIALYEIGFPKQSMTSGILHVQVIEASVVHVIIAGKTSGQRLDLVSAYASKILQSRPLRRSVLERNMLLMGDIAGAKIGSKFLPVPGHPEQVQLELGIEQKKYFGGFDINNQGTPILDSTQAVFNAGVNNLFHEGERTQLVVGLPLDITRYQYYGINDIEPLGGNGMSLSLSAGNLASYPIDQAQSGTAQILSGRLNAPLIRSVHTNVNLSFGMDYLNSDNAYLGFTTSDERTRALRVLVSYTDDKYFNGTNTATAGISQGIDILGARQASSDYGGPDFTKGNFSLQRLQVLPFGFVLRLAASGQFTANRLPPSEEFDYGGPDYGLAFTTAELTGDEGIAGLAAVFHPLPAAYLPKQLAGTSLFVLTDYGRVWNRDTVDAPATNDGASFAAGVKILVLGKVSVELGAATPVIKPQYVGSSERWRFVIATAGQF